MTSRVLEWERLENDDLFRRSVKGWLEESAVVKKELERAYDHLVRARTDEWPKRHQSHGVDVLVGDLVDEVLWLREQVEER